MDCINRIISEYEGRLKPEEIEFIYRRVANKMKFDPEPHLDFEGKPVDAAKDRARNAFEKVFAEEVKKRADQLRNKYLAADAINRGMKKISDNSERGHVKALTDILVGDGRGRQKELTLEGRKNGILNLDAAELGPAFEDYMSFWGAKLSDEQAQAIVRELDGLDSGDKAAKLLVEDWTVWSEKSWKTRNELGANQGHRTDWRLPQSWDPVKVRNFGLSAAEKLQMFRSNDPAVLKALREKARENFVTKALPLIDPMKYRDIEGKPLDDAGLAQAMREVFQTISTEGLNKLQLGAQEAEPQGIASQLAAHRELHFKDAASWYELNKQAGSADVLGIMEHAVVKNARDQAILETFSPHNNVVFNTLLTYAEQQDALAGGKLKKGVTKAKMIYAELAGTAGLPVSERGAQVAHIMQAWRNWTAATHLGSVLLSQVSDLATFNVIARTNGLGMGRAMEFWFKSMNPANAADRKAAARAGIAADMVLHDVGARIGEAVQGRTLSSNVANRALRMYGMQWWQNGGQRAFQSLIGFHLADVVKGGDADPHFTAMLQRYGIGEKDMEIIRRAEPVEIFGHDIITPVSVKILGDSPEIREAAIKVAAMMTTESRIAILEPDAATKAITRLGQAPGTFTGELMRTGVLFKSFMVGMIRQVLPRVFGAEGTSGYKAGIVAQYVLSMMIGGAISTQLRTMARGLNPRDMTDPAFWLAAGAQSGGLGLFGDFMFADVNRFGQGLVSSIAGPQLRIVEDIHKLTIGNIQEAAQGKDTHFAAELMQNTKNYALPYVNAFYTRAALDHLIFFTAQEAANPGYLRRMKQSVENSQNTTWYWPPTEPLPSAPDFDYAFHGKK